MNFDNPQQLDCPGCGTRLVLPLEDVVGLEASCPACGYSFRELGLSMRRHSCQMAGYFVTWEAVWIFEARYEFSAAEQDVRALETPRHLVDFVRAKSCGRAAQAEVLAELATRIRRPLDPSHLDTPIPQLVPSPV